MGDIVPGEFRLWRNRDFLELFYCRWLEDQKTGSPLMLIDGFLFLLPASIQAQIIVKGIRRNKTAAIETVRKPGSGWGDLVELSFVKQNVLQVRLHFILQTFESSMRAKQANITGRRAIDLWHEFHFRKAVFKASGTRFWVARQPCLATKSR